MTMFTSKEQNGEIYMIAVTLIVTWLLVPGRLVFVFQRPLTSWDFHAQQFPHSDDVRKKKNEKNPPPKTVSYWWEHLVDETGLNSQEGYNNTNGHSL